MKEVIGSTFLFKIVIIFIFFFASFLAISINYSQAFRVKNSIINILEQYEGLNNASKQKIVDNIINSGYYREINCTGPTGNGNNVTDENGKTAEGICVKPVTTGVGDKYTYYQVTTFVSFSLPIIGNAIALPVKGETKVITNNSI